MMALLAQTDDQDTAQHLLPFTTFQALVRSIVEPTLVELNNALPTLQGTTLE